MSGEKDRSYLDSPVFARTNRTGEALSEFRCNLPRTKLDVLDAIALFESKNSGEYVSRREVGERIINDYLQNKIDESILIHDVINRNPSPLDK